MNFLRLNFWNTALSKSVTSPLLVLNFSTWENQIFCISYSKICIILWVQKSYAWILKVGFLGGRSKISNANPHQMTHHFNGLSKRWLIVKTRNLHLNQKKNSTFWNFDTFYTANVWERLCKLQGFWFKKIKLSPSY